MKKTPTNFNKELKKIKLTASERADLRDRVCTYMEYHPVVNKPAKKAVAGKQKKVFGDAFVSVRLFSWQYQKFVAMGVVMLAIVLPSLAERSVPGDILYPMKVQVNEEVRSKLSFSSYAKVEWEADRLERRLAEARVLKEEGKLTEEIEIEVAEAVKKHSEAAKEEIASIRESNEDDAALAEISFMSVLEAQNDIFTLEDEEEEESVLLAVASATGTTTKSHALAEALLSVQADMAVPVATVVTEARLLALLERETTFAEELFQTIRDKASEAEKNDIKRRLEDIDRIVVDVQAELVLAGEGAIAETASTTTAVNAESVTQLRQALINARKLISFMTDIRVRNKVTVEELVPINLTEEERLANIQSTADNTKANLAKVRSYTVSSVNSLKLQGGIVEVEELLLITENQVSAGLLDEAEVAVANAEEITEDLLVLISADASATSTADTVATSTPVVATTTDAVVSTTSDESVVEVSASTTDTVEVSI